MRGYLFILLLLAACQSNEADAPELITKPAQQIGTTSAVLEAEITEVGPIRPITFGFLYDVQPDLNIGTGANQYIGGTTSDPRLYSIKVETFLPNATYYYRSFAANSDFTRIYYGAVVSFTTLP
jgi:hypothetical protein